MVDLPTRCIDPVIKYCQECKYGHNIYPSWIETAEDLADRTFETVCALGFDKGRPEDEPTDEELKEFDKLYEYVRCQATKPTQTLPFCGSDKLKIDSKRTSDYGNKKHCSVTVRCMKCHAGSPVVGIKMPDRQYNEREICEKEVIEA